MQLTFKRFALAAAGAGVLTLIGCGGGGGGTAASGGGSDTTLSVSGTAATGAAIANASVQAKCNGGSASATTAVDGSFTITLTAGTLPCALKVVASTGDLFSIITGSGTTANANITPVTHLIVASLVGSDPAGYFTAFSSTDIAALTPAAVQGAQEKVVLALQSNGINAAGLGDLISGKLVAASAGTTGNALDQLLDALGAKLAGSNVTLAQLSTTVSQTSAVATPSSTPSVAFEVALQPAAASCPALRSGIYRVVLPTAGPINGDGSESLQKVTINATEPSITDAAGAKVTLTPATGSPCRFSTSGGGDMVVSQSGAFGIKSGDGFWGMGFPEQTIAVSQLAGDWNFLGFETEDRDGPLAPIAALLTIGNSGDARFTSACPSAKNCESIDDRATVTVNSAGGYNVDFGVDGVARMVAFRAGGGEIMLVLVDADGSWVLGTRRKANPQRSVGSIASGWNLGAVNQAVNNTFRAVATAITEGRNTVTSINDTNDSFTRNNITNFPSEPAITRPETVFNNSVDGIARVGLRWRKPETAVTNSAGATVSVSEFIDLPLRGIGMNATAVPGNQSFSLSVTKP